MTPSEGYNRRRRSEADVVMVRARREVVVRDIPTP
jgi:hypothetical protein